MAQADAVAGKGTLSDFAFAEHRASGCPGAGDRQQRAERLAAALTLGLGWALVLAGRPLSGADELGGGIYGDTCSATCGETCGQERTRAAVTNVVDGDTIDVVIVTTTYRVRYIGMDTPERGKPFFDEATEANRRLVTNGVCLERDTSETDAYGRLLRYVYADDGRCEGTFVNAALIRMGLALVAYYPPDVRHFYLFARLQADAMRACVGLWVWSPTCVFLPRVALPARNGTGR